MATIMTNTSLCLRTVRMHELSQLTHVLPNLRLFSCRSLPQLDCILCVAWRTWIPLVRHPTQLKQAARQAMAAHPPVDWDVPYIRTQPCHATALHFMAPCCRIRQRCRHTGSSFHRDSAATRRALQGTRRALQGTRRALQGTRRALQGTAGHTQGTAGHTQGTAGHTQGTAGHTQGTAGHCKAHAGHCRAYAGHTQGTAGHTQGTRRALQGTARHTQGTAGHTQGTAGQASDQPAEGHSLSAAHCSRPIFGGTLPC
jgi:hypothetical protein